MWTSHSVRSSRRPLLLAFGPAGTMFALIPAAILVVVLFVELPRMRTFAPAKRTKKIGVGEDRWRQFALLTTSIVVRSIARRSRKDPPSERRTGRAARVLSISMFSAAPLLAASIFATSRRGPFAIVVCIAIAGFVGLVFVPSQTAFVVLGQEYLPNHLGIAAGVSLGLVSQRANRAAFAG